MLPSGGKVQMVLFQPSAPKSDAIVRPPCDVCATTMWLAQIEPEKPGFEIYMFYCPKCGHTQTSRAELK